MFVKGLLAVVPVIFMLTNAKLSTLKTPIKVPDLYPMLGHIGTAPCNIGPMLSQQCLIFSNTWSCTEAGIGIDGDCVAADQVRNLQPLKS